MIHPLWYACIVTRLFLAFSVAKYTKYFKYFRILLLIIGLGFGYKYLTGSNNETQVAKVFWHNTRVIHAILYLLAFAMFNPMNSSRILVCDVIFSILYRTYLETF